MNPAEFGKLANRITLWKSQKPVGGKRTLAQSLEFAIATVAAVADSIKDLFALVHHGQDDQQAASQYGWSQRRLGCVLTSQILLD